MKKVFKKILILISIVVFCIIGYVLVFGIEKEELQTYKINGIDNFEDTYKGVLKLTGNLKEFKEKTGLKQDEIYLDLNYKETEANILFALNSYKIENVKIDKDKIELSSKINLTYFPLDPKEKLNGVFEITEIHFDGYLSKTDKIITSSRIVGGRFDFNHEVESSKQIIESSKNYKGTGYLKSGDLKVEFEFDFIENKL